MKTIEVKIHSVAEDGLPDMRSLTGQVAFLWNGAIVSGWPIDAEYGGIDPNNGQLWEASEDRMGGPYANVTHWLEFPVEFWNLEKES